jgi:hypothetical protein
MATTLQQKNIHVVGLFGQMGSGKDTVATILIKQHGFRRMSFASKLKDMVAGLFDWPRHMLEGDTKISREWREKVDVKAATDFSMPTLTPRLVLQLFGTEVVRKGFHDDFWIILLKRAIEALPDGSKVVITDVRFPNEAKCLEQTFGAKMFRVMRGPLPEWWDTAVHNPEAMPTEFPKVHQSEWAVAGVTATVIDNNGTIPDLHNKIKTLML